MITYSTIDEAFTNGNGDVFFTKGEEVICRSRKEENLLETMQAQGFMLLPHDEVLRRAAAENILKFSPVSKDKKPDVSRTQIIFSRCDFLNGYDGFYDEFPDAYGQHL